MKSYQFTPGKDLCDLVCKYIYMENSLGSFSFNMIPRNYPAVFFVAPEIDTLEFVISATPTKLKSLNIYFAGSGYAPSIVNFQGYARCWVVVLRAYSNNVAFNDVARTFVNKILQVTESRPELRSLNEKLWEPQMMAASQIMLLESHFASLADQVNVHPVVQYALQEIYTSKGVTTIEELASKSWTCNRTLLRQFTHEVGINPKKYSDMIRFSWLMNDILKKKSNDKQMLSMDYGYYDLSHLRKEAMRFFGHPLNKTDTWKTDLNLLLI